MAVDDEGIQAALPIDGEVFCRVVVVNRGGVDRGLGCTNGEGIVARPAQDGELVVIELAGVEDVEMGAGASRIDLVGIISAAAIEFGLGDANILNDDGIVAALPADGEYFDGRAVIRQRVAPNQDMRGGNGDGIGA